MKVGGVVAAASKTKVSRKVGVTFSFQVSRKEGFVWTMHSVKKSGKNYHFLKSASVAS